MTLAIGYVWTIAGGQYVWLIGTGVFVWGLVPIWLRGYLVPGTPELTKRYFPDWLLEPFYK